jgi:hypothetical protein
VVPGAPLLGRNVIHSGRFPRSAAIETEPSFPVTSLCNVHWFDIRARRNQDATRPIESIVVSVT